MKKLFLVFDVAFYPRRITIVVLTALFVSAMIQLSLIEQVGLLLSLSSSFGYIFLALGLKLYVTLMLALFSNTGHIVATKIVECISPVHKDDLPKGTMFFVIITLGVVALILFYPLFLLVAPDSRSLVR